MKEQLQSLIKKFGLERYLPKNLYLQVITIFFVGSIFAFFLASLGSYIYFNTGLPPLTALENYKPNLITKVYSSDGRVIGEYYIERRTIVALEQMPKHLKDSFLSAEDAQFYEHAGINYIGILRAVRANLMAGGMVQGASTITQQVAKTFLLTNERKISRKVREALLAKRIENNLTKDEILYLYLNQIYFGSGAYGVQEASATYFGKDVSELTVAEAALIAGLPKAPSRYSPYINKDKSIKRQEHVLKRLFEDGKINRETYDEALNEELKLRPRKNEALWSAPYVTEHIRRHIEETYGAELLFKGGLRIYSTVDVEMQKAANEAIKFGLRGHDKRRGYRGPIMTLKTLDEAEAFKKEEAKDLKKRPLKVGNIYRAYITDVKKKKELIFVDIGNHQGILKKRDFEWAKLYNPTKDPDGGKKVDPITVFNVGDVIHVQVKGLPKKEDDPIPLALEQETQAEAALYSMEPQTGFVKAMVGGSDYSKTQFNRAIQALRQPGSVFKPVIYSAAIASGYTPATIVIDSPIIYENTVEEEPEETDKTTETGTEEKIEEKVKVKKTKKPETWMWKPRNYEQRFYGPTTIRTALTKSRNIVTIKVLQDIGVDTVIKNAKALGINSPLARDLSLALGSSVVTLEEMTRAFAVFPNKGNLVEPIFFTKIVDRNGEVLEEHETKTTEALDVQSAYLTTNLLKGVMDNGTGRRARLKDRRPAGGKTGTTNNLNDAWYVGFVPTLATGVWIGYDSERVLGNKETGARAAIPIWKKYMNEALVGTRGENFAIPDGLEFARIDPKTGFLANSTTENSVYEAFKRGTAPHKVSPVTGGRHPDFDFNKARELGGGRGGEFRDFSDDLPPL
ncbi:MAG: transglycosylase domain-containing protein [Deltaproteobacteria bacterium]|nr:transglycosylase domain-containing protein [Deltaproteobacteria bacterium]